MRVLPLNYINGKEHLKKLGYEFCDNPYYMKSGSIIVHWNKITKFWIVEGE